MAFLDSVRALDNLYRIRLAQHLIEAFFDVMEKHPRELNSEKCLEIVHYLIELYQEQMGLYLGELENNLEKLSQDFMLDRQSKHSE